jgi:hypothetical protein
MNERERWIVYPLLFFALGASLRDKFLQHVSSKEIECQRLVAKEILCEDLSILDPVTDDRVVAKLTSGEPTGAKDSEDVARFGVLLLFDSAGKELCGVANNELFVRRIQCEGVAVVDRDHPTQEPLGAFTSMEVTPAAPGEASRRVGVLVLNNQQFWQLLGLPPRGMAPLPESVEPRPNNETPADGEEPPAGGERGRNPDESAG